MSERYVYVVFGATREYSDHREWTICAFEAEEEAAEQVVKLTACANTLPECDECKALGWCDRGCALKGRKAMAAAGDPHYQTDYTGTRYGFEKVELR